MAKRQLKQSEIAKKLKAKADLVQVLREVRDSSIDELRTKYRNQIVEVSDGDLQLSITVDGTNRSFGLTENPSIPAQGHFLTATFAEAMLRTHNKSEFLVAGLAYVVGLANGWTTSLEQNDELRQKINELTTHRRKGGAATKRLTPEQENLARDLIGQQWTKYVSKSQACHRVAAILSKDYGISVSGRTLQKLVEDQPGKR